MLHFDTLPAENGIKYSQQLGLIQSLKSGNSISFDLETIESAGSSLKGTEDTIVAIPDKQIFAVFDGVTGLFEKQDRGISIGRKVAEAARDTFQKHQGAFQESFTMVDIEIKKILLSVLGEKPTPSMRSGVTGIAFRIYDNMLEWIGIGDTYMLVLYENGSFEAVYDGDNHDNENLKQFQYFNNNPDLMMSPDSRILPFLIRKRQDANISYGVINGDSKFHHFLRQGVKDISGISDIIIFTDGLKPPKEDPDSHDDNFFEQLTRVYKEGGLQGMLGYVRNLEKIDINRNKFPRFKVHDDVGAIAIHFK